MKRTKRLSTKDIIKKSDLSFLKIKNSSHLTPCKDIIGQKRAINSIILGLEINKMGYNIYLSGQPGVGKKTIIKSLLFDIAKKKKVPNDWCYVYNFLNPKEPKAITMAPGRGKTFKKDMEQFIEILKASIPKTFESKDFEDEKIKLADFYNKKKEDLFTKLREFAKQNDIQIQFAPTGIVTMPLLNSKPVSHEVFETFDEKTKAELKGKKDKVDIEVGAILKETRLIDKEYMEKVNDLENKAALFAVSDLMENLKDKYKDLPAIKEYLEQVKNDIVSNIDKFLPVKQPVTFLHSGIPNTGESKNPLTEYSVNVIIDNSQTKGAPVIFETQPNYINLFGSIEREVRMGAMVTDFTLIRDGSIFKANGGYLVVEVLDILKFPFVWDTLKKVIENGELRVEDAYQNYGYANIVGMRPEPIKIDIKVIMTGQPHIFHLLETYDI
ncbi:MAG: AAA family ATPase, partial [Thermodesulfobacteriota bacterium]